MCHAPLNLLIVTSKSVFLKPNPWATALAEAGRDGTLASLFPSSPLILVGVNGGVGAGAGGVSGRGGVGNGGGMWGRRLTTSGVVLTTINLPHASFGPLKIAI